jgi:hypothetical protein
MPRRRAPRTVLGIVSEADTRTGDRSIRKGRPDLRGNLRERSVGHVTQFLVEFYVSRADSESVDRAAACTRLVAGRLAAGELTRQGTPVRCVRSTFVPEDETCFFLYEATSADAVRDAALRAALPFERVAQAIAADRTTGRSPRGDTSVTPVPTANPQNRLSRSTDLRSAPSARERGPADKKGT